MWALFILRADQPGRATWAPLAVRSGRTIQVILICKKAVDSFGSVAIYLFAIRISGFRFHSKCTCACDAAATCSGTVPDFPSLGSERERGVGFVLLRVTWSGHFAGVPIISCHLTRTNERWMKNIEGWFLQNDF